MSHIEAYSYRRRFIKGNPYSSDSVLRRERQTVMGILERHVYPLVEASEAKRILSVACGVGDEAKSLLKMFPNAHITGIDISRVDINIARKHHHALRGRIKFYVRDARLADSFGNRPWDIILFRNPQVTSGGQNWEAMYSNAVSALQPGGTLITTTLSDYEMNFVRGYYLAYGIEVVRDRLTMLSENFDSNILIGRKLAE